MQNTNFSPSWFVLDIITVVMSCSPIEISTSLLDIDFGIAAKPISLWMDIYSYNNNDYHITGRVKMSQNHIFSIYRIHKVDLMKKK